MYAARQCWQPPPGSPGGLAGMTTSVLLLSLMQPLHGLTFALLHLACIRMMGTSVDTRRRCGAGSLRVWLGFNHYCPDLLLRHALCFVCGAAFFPMAALCAVALPLAWLGFAHERDRSAAHTCCKILAWRTMGMCRFLLNF